MKHHPDKGGDPEKVKLLVGFGNYMDLNIQCNFSLDKFLKQMKF